MDAIVSTLQLDQLDTIDRHKVTHILSSLTEQLTQAQDELELLQKKHAPLLEEFNNQKAGLQEAFTKINSQFDALESSAFITALERRRNDAKTEEAYLDKILNREIHGEFVTILKAELRSLLQSVDPNNNLEQVPASHSGCARLQGASLFVSAGTEKLCSTIHLCCAEVASKVYPEQPEKYGAFAEFCLQLLLNFSTKLVTKKAQQLPQFMALLANDVAYLTAFVFERFSGIKGASATLSSLRRLRQQILTDFVNLHRREINDFLADASAAGLDRAIKRVTLHLTRLANVLRPVLLGADFVNVLVALLQEAQQSAWKLVYSFSDIGVDELKPIEQFVQQVIELPGKVFTDPQMQSVIAACLPFASKLAGLTELLPLGLVAIINAYHRDDFKGELKPTELTHFINAIFANSPLKSEFFYELSLDE